jgi:hypothetical protein
LDDLGINTVILGDHHRKDKIVAYLNKNPKWRSIYDEKDGLIWVRVYSLKARPTLEKSPLAR